MLPKFVGFLWFVYSVRHYCLLVNRPNFVLWKSSWKIFRSKISENDLFVHKTEGEGTIRDGDKVEFDVGETEKGPNAVKVKRVE